MSATTIDFATYWIWFMAAALLVGAELATGTFYLLAIAAATAVGGLVALAGASLTLQFMLTAASALVFAFAAHHWRIAKTQRGQQDSSLDVGQRVVPGNWDETGRTRAEYRGTTWDAVLLTPDTPRTAHMYIAEVRGSVLVLTDRPPAG